MGSPEEKVKKVNGQQQHRNLEGNDAPPLPLMAHGNDGVSWPPAMAPLT